MRQIKSALQEKYEFDIPVVVRAKEELEEIQKHPTFLKDQVYVMFLEKGIPDEQHVLLTSIVDNEFVVWNRRNVIINLSKNYHQTKFTNAFFEKKLSMASTARNQNTVNKVFLKI